MPEQTPPRSSTFLPSPPIRDPFIPDRADYHRDFSTPSFVASHPTQMTVVLERVRYNAGDIHLIRPRGALNVNGDLGFGQGSLLHIPGLNLTQRLENVELQSGSGPIDLTIRVRLSGPITLHELSDAAGGNLIRETADPLAVVRVPLERADGTPQGTEMHLIRASQDGRRFGPNPAHSATLQRDLDTALATLNMANEHIAELDRRINYLQSERDRLSLNRFNMGESVVAPERPPATHDIRPENDNEFLFRMLTEPARVPTPSMMRASERRLELFGPDRPENGTPTLGRAAWTDADGDSDPIADIAAARRTLMGTARVSGRTNQTAQDVIEAMFADNHPAADVPNAILVADVRLSRHARRREARHNAQTRRRRNAAEARRNQSNAS